jgi:hypothetical protein
LPDARSSADCRALIGAIRHPVYRACFATMYACGLRMSEAISLPVSAVDSKQMLLHIIGKGKSQHVAYSTMRKVFNNARLLAMDDTHVTFRYKDREANQWRTCRLTGVEFLRRLLMHVLPKGFHKARYYGLWHPSKRPLQQLARLLLTLETPAQTAMPITVADLAAEAQRAGDDRYIGPESSDGGFRPRCPQCGSDRVIHLAELTRGRSP